MNRVVPPATFPSRFSEQDVYLFREGSHDRLYERFGAHPAVVDGAWGTHFAVWAPGASQVSLIGDFNDWDPEAHPMVLRDLRPEVARGERPTGIWEAFAPGVGKGALYKFHVRSRVHQGYAAAKADPFAFGSECPPQTASVVADPQHRWSDGTYLEIGRAHV